ncbi:FAD:protein FMN transferase [Urechidicola sp. KH5]
MKQKAYLFLFLVIFFSCQSEPIEYQSVRGVAFGTTYSITYENIPNKDYTIAIDSLINVMNQSLSTYVPDSQISKINDGASTFKVDSYFEEVFIKSNRIYEETEGIFDPTIGTLVNAWGFGPEKALNNISDTQVDSMMQYVGFDKVTLNNGVIVKSNPNIYFDFNAIAKGFGIDIIGRFLEREGISNYLIELGGEIRAKGTNEKGEFWRVAIEDPNTDGSRSYSKIVTLENVAMATSGNYRKFNIDNNGRKFVHTVNALTGYAEESDLLSATVVAPLDCADVDGYATAFMAMGLTKTKDFLGNHPTIEAHLIYANEAGELQSFTTSRLKVMAVD